MPFADNDRVKLHYEIEGDGPPLLLQHGFAGTLDAWRLNGFIRGLSNDYKCIFMSARGRGKSDKPHDEKAYYFKNMVLDCVAVLDDLGIKKANYLGYSMGGVIGLRIPMYAPDRFLSLIMGGAAYASGSSTQKLEDIGPAYDALVRAVNNGEENPMMLILPILEKNMGSISPERKAAILAQDPKALAAAWQARKEEPFPDIPDYLASFTFPCLMYVGENDPRFGSVRETAMHIPGAEFFSLPGLNHPQTNAKSELTLPFINRFLARVNTR